MGKIHELLAVEDDLKIRGKKVLAETKKLFETGEALFVGQVKTYQTLDEEKGDKFPAEVKPLSAEVKDVLGTLQKEYGRYLDLVLSKETSNSLPGASADVILNGGTVLFQGMTVTALLNLESRLEDLRSVYAAIPTNSITDEWTKDADNDIFKTAPSITYRTKKVKERIVLADATDRHPAQVNLIDVDVRDGIWTTVKTSGMLSPKDKADRMERLNELLAAVKQARQRGNDIQAVDLKLSEKIFKYIDGE